MVETFQFCPKCGASALVFDKSRSVSCRLCDFHYFFNVSAAVAAIIENDKNELLLTRRNRYPGKNMLDLPGGFMEFDESAETSVRREIKEELNLKIKKLKYLGTLPGIYRYDGFEYQVINIAFRCSIEDISSMRLSNEISDCVFLAKDQIDLEQIGIEAVRQIIIRYC